MALQIHHLRPPIPPAPAPASSVGSLSSWRPTKQSTIAGDLHRSFSSVKMISSKTRKNKGFRFSVRVRSSLETSGTPVVVGQVTEVDKDSFWPIVNAAGDKTVVLDMYTQWFPVRVRSSLETSGTPVVVGQVTEVDKDSFWPIVSAAGDKTVVLDMYTQW